MKKYIVYTMYVFIVFALVNMLSFQNNLASDGFLEIGFPFVFYRDYHGKIFDCQVELGFSIWRLLLNFSITLVVVTLPCKIKGNVSNVAKRGLYEFLGYGSDKLTRLIKLLIMKNLNK